MTPRFISVIAWLALGTALATSAALAQPAAKDDKLDLVIKGELKADDPKDMVTKLPSKVHTVKLRGGQAYVITLNAVDDKLDPFLRIEDSTGKELARDDDGGGFPNSLIQLKPPKDADYRIIASAYEGIGKYVLRVRVGELSKEEKLVAQAKTLDEQGEQWYRQGKHTQALGSWKEALVIREKLYPPARFPDGRPDFAANLANVGLVLYHLSQPSKALPYFERGLEMYEKLYPASHYPDGDSELAQCLNNLGLLFVDLGQPSKALSYHERALVMQEKLYPAARYRRGDPHLAASLHNMGWVFLMLGQPGKALPYAERALAMYEKLYPPTRYPQGHTDLAISLINLGNVLNRAGLPGKALPFYERSLAMQEKLYPATRYPDGHPDLVASLNGMGQLLEVLGRRDEALRYHERALALQEKVYPESRYPHGHPDLATGLNNLAGVLQSLGQPSKALPYYQRAVAMREKLYPAGRFPDGHPQFASSLNNLGVVLEHLGRANEALPYYERSLAMYRRLTQRLANSGAEADALDFARSSPPAKDSFLSLAHRLPEEAPQRFYAQVWQGKGFITRILQRRHEATRVAVLKDDKVKKTWEKLQDVRRELGGLLLADPSKVKERDELVRDLSDKKEKLEADLATALPQIERIKELAKLGPDDLAAKLPKDAALLDFMRYEFFDKGKHQGPHYVAFLVAPGRKVERVALGPAGPIDIAIRSWRQAIDERQPNTAPAALAKLVWNKIAPHLPKETKTLLIAADGDLTRLPFAALPGKLAGRLLLEDYLITYVPHAPFVLEQLMFPPLFAKTSIAVLALGEVPYSLPGSKDELDPPWPELKATGPEIRQLAKLDPKREVIVLTGAKATVAEALAKLPQVGYAHFATHGFFEDKALADERTRVNELLKHWEFRAEGTKRLGLGLRNPLSFTGLVLAGANTGRKAGPEGGILSSEAIVELPLEGLRLAVLSACETGLGELTEGEGVQGLQRAFHLAGCPNVVASLWRVNDAATAALMNKFYHEMWVNNKAPGEALRLAQLTIYRHPERIPALAGDRGQERLHKAVRLSDTPLVASQRADTKLWAAFVLSGLGR